MHDNIKTLFANDRHRAAAKRAKEIIQWYREGSDLTDDETHVLNDCVLEHGQILDNIVHTAWFEGALTENLEALS